MKKKLLAIALILNVSLICANTSDLFHKDSWSFLQDKLIETPKRKASGYALTKLIPSAAISGGIGYGSYKLLNEYMSNIYDDNMWIFWDSDKAETPHLHIASALGLLIFCYTYYKIYNFLVYSFEREQFIDILKNWDVTQKLIPEELKEAFDKAKENYVINPYNFEYKELDEVIRILKGRIAEHFKINNTGKSYLNLKKFSNLFNFNFMKVGKDLISYVIG